MSSRLEGQFFTLLLNVNHSFQFLSCSKDACPAEGGKRKPAMICEQI